MEQLEASRRRKIKWYEENIPGRWKLVLSDLRTMLKDACWRDELDRFCRRHFGVSENELRAVCGLEKQGMLDPHGETLSRAEYDPLYKAVEKSYGGKVQVFENEGGPPPAIPRKRKT